MAQTHVERVRPDEGSVLVAMEGTDPPGEPGEVAVGWTSGEVLDRRIKLTLGGREGLATVWLDDSETEELIGALLAAVETEP